MALILVVEQEGRYIERIRDALGSEGWRSQVVSGHPEALRAASSEAPSLVLVNSELEGATGVYATFARSNGGPGVVAMVPERQAGESSSGRLAVDEVLAKPFTDQELRLVVRRILSGARQAAAGKPAISPAAAAGVEAKLTSAQIFGDLVLEIESEIADARSAAAGPAAPVPPPPAVAASAPPPPEPAPTAARPPRPLDDAEIQRRLEQTLSGVLGPARGAAVPAAPAPRRRSRDADVEQLLSETLSDLDLGKDRFGGAAAAGPRPPSPSTPEPASPPTPLPASAAPPAPSPTDFRALFGDLDLIELEELAPPRRSPAAPTAAEPEPAPPPSAPHLTPPELAPSTLEPPPPLGEAPAFGEASPGLSDPLEAGLPAVERLEQFGQYALLERIAAGGMAEVWKARMRGVEGFQKTVAIKRILPHLTDSSDFITMFVDEAKLAAQLSHPNITHIYDLGKIGQHYYIAMEYVEGQNLRAILNATAEKAIPLPVGLALLIGARLASALDYAHRKRDFDQREMGLVHRDVSPQNVLISSEGDIKLCDFGIAKAVANASRTQMGALKGKLQYMSPEQAWGRAVDPRSDIFSLGSLLFEMATGRRLFTGDNEISVLEAVRECHVEEPWRLNAEIPAEFNAIILKALAKEPGDRYQSAGQLQQELEQMLYTRKPTPGPADLAAFLGRLRSAPEAPATAAKAGAAVAAGGPVESAADELTPAAAPMPVLPEPPEVAAGAAAAATASPAIVRLASATASGVERPLPRPEPAALEAVAPRGPVDVEEGGGRGRWLLIATILLVLAAGVAAALYFSIASPRGPAPEATPLVVTPGEPAAKPAAVEPPAVDETPARGAAVEAATPGAAAGEPATGAAAAAPTPAELEQLIEEELARREEKLRKKLEAEQRRLEEELARAQAKAQQQEPPPATGGGEGVKTVSPPPSGGSP